MTKAGEIYYDIKIKDNGFNAQIGRYEKKMENLDKKGQKAADSLGKIGSKPINTSSISAADQKLQALGTRLENTGKRMTSVGKRMSVGFTAPIVAGMAVSTKAYMKFDEKVTEINSLLRESGETAQESSKRYAKVYDYAQKSSVKYGVASEQVTEGMEEMVKKGYNLNQTIASMPAIFDASRASGDKFETVMSVTTSTLEQFGMISKDTNKQMQYTNKVADVLTYVADKTAAGFTDMGYAMQYIGPVAHSMGYSLTDTAAAIGLLSNRGLEGQKAGTGLRGMLTSLLKPSKKASEAMESVGLSLTDSKGKMKDMPRLIDDINKSTKGMNRAQKNAFLTMVFGREPLSAVNTLLEAGGDSLRKYSKGADQASGYTKQVADNMRKAKKFSVDQFKASLEALEQNVGKKLMPALTPAIEWANRMITSFSKLSGEQQQNILKWTGMAAAIWPVLTIGGKIYTMFSGVINMFSKIGTVANVGSKLLPLTAGLGTTATAAEGATVAAGGFVAAMGGWPVVIAGASAALLGVGIAALAKHKAAVEALESRVKQWGSDIGAAADSSMQRFNHAASNGKVAMDNFASGTTSDSKQIVKAFKDMADEIEKNTEKSLGSFEKHYNSYSAGVKAILKKSKEEAENDANERKENVSAQQDAIENIYKNAAKNHRNLSSNESKQVNDIYKAMQVEQIESLNISQKKKKNIIAAMNGQVKDMSQQALQEQSDIIGKSMDKTLKQYDDTAKNLKKDYKNNVIDHKAYTEAITRNEDDKQKSVEKNAAAFIRTQKKLMKAQGMSKEQIENQLEKGFQEMGLDYQHFNRLMTQEVAGAANNASDMIAKGVSKASLAWNKLILDPKTGEVRTNLPEFIKKSTESEKGWNNLKYIIKNANLNSNAKATITDALVQNGKWNNLSFKEKKLLATYKGSQQVMQALKDVKQWDKLTPKQQALIAKAKTKGQLVKALKDMKVWDKLPEKTKRLLADGKDVKKKTDKAKKDVDSYNNKKVKTKDLKGNSTNVVNEIGKGVKSILRFNNTNPKTQHAKAFTNASDFIIQTNSIQRAWDNLKLSRKSGVAIGSAAGAIAGGVRAAKGLKNHKGGDLMVNDAKGSKYEELVTYPNGASFIPEGKNIIIPNAPKGTEVTRGDKTAKLMRDQEIPHYAKGTKSKKLTAYQRAAERRRKARERATARRKANTAYTRRVSDKIANARTDYKTGDISGKTYIKRLKAINKHYKTTAAQTRQIRLNIASANKELKTQKTKFNKAIKDATSKYYDKVKDINKKAKDSIKDAKKTYSDALKSNRESAYNQVSLFDKAETEKASGSELFKNLKTQTAQQKDFMAQLNKLKKRGVNRSLIDELRNMGVSATGETKAIAGMSSSQLKAYQTEWKKKHTNANKLGLDMSAGDKTIMNNAIKAANAKAKRDLAAANKTWLKNLDKAKQYKAAGSKLGTQTVAGIISGFKKMDGPLAKQTSKLAKTITKTIKKRLKIHSPSRLMRDEVGAQVPAGVGVGMLDNLGTIHTASKKMQQMLTNSAPSLAVPVTPYTKDIAAYGNNGLKGEGSGSKTTVQPIKIINQTVLNGRVVAEETEEFITEIQDNKIKRMTRARGLTI